MMSADMRMELERREWEQAGDEEDREHQQRQERVKVGPNFLPLNTHVYA